LVVAGVMLLASPLPPEPARCADAGVVVLPTFDDAAVAFDF